MKGSPSMNIISICKSWFTLTCTAIFSPSDMGVEARRVDFPFSAAISFPYIFSARTTSAVVTGQFRSVPFCIIFSRSLGVA